ncbi:hypothetical protein KIK06_19210 [Nocardiopsis sp. EMB25]|uniref:hypothetical protein n=1 Tax=Nocardiopsis sp. EMB25 TaxID=2835867 RepID=UPI002284CBB1|nr:hypothetical protein [Nocardiopsis sp. EMB25]MCY9786023.1 hypothetical protein [Nocardiopsis sp. EMB25]
MVESSDDRDRETEGTAGVYIAGSMIGGSVATGPDAEAEDRGRREGVPTAADLPAPSSRLNSAPPGQVVIGGHLTGGAAALGPRSRAVDASVHSAAPSVEALLAGIADVRRQLGERERTFEVEAVDRELERAEREFGATGRIGRTLLEHLVRLFGSGSLILRSLTGTGPLMDILANALEAAPPVADELQDRT